MTDERHADTQADVVADADTRRRALAIDSSFIVQAPAGSGKTELLIQRYLSLLAIASRPEAVVAVTFTRKAAAEMRERVIHALAAVADGPPSEPYLRDRFELARAVLARSERDGWNIIESPHRLEINTIDSLCAKLVRSLPLLAAFGGAPSPTEDVEPLYREAVRRTLDEAPRDARLAEDLARLLSRREMRRGAIENQFVDMLGKRDQWTSDALETRTEQGASDMLANIEMGIETAMREVISSARSCFSQEELAVIHEIAVLSRADLEEAGKSCDWPSLGASATLGHGIESIDAWKQARTLLFTGGNKLRGRTLRGGKKGTKQLDLWTDLRAGILLRGPLELERIADTAVALSNLPTRAAFTAETEAGVMATFRLLLQAHRELWALFVERGETDFVEMAHKALSALGSDEAPTDLLERLDRGVEHLLVDEFQDTSIGQNELVRRLTVGWTRGDGKTLFLVGDPMQSIYRFRKAEVGLFLKARSDDGLFDNIDLEVLQLTVNFRSQPRVIDWVNRYFGALMGDDDDVGRGVVGYAPSIARPDVDDGPEPEIRLWECADEDEPAGTTESEAEGLAALIENDLLPDARKREGRVAVLVRARRHAALLLTALRARGIAYVPEGLDTLLDRAVVQDLRSLTRFILHRGDRLCGLALLRGPLVGLTLADLTELVEPDVVSSVPESRAEGGAGSNQNRADIMELMRTGTDRLSEDGARRVARACAVLDAVRAEQGRRRLCDLVEGAWVALGGPAVAGRAGADDAEAFFSLLAGLEKGGTIDPTELDRRLAKSDAPGGGASEADISVMTMHAAKGLEFDTVVLLRVGYVPKEGSSQPLLFETDPRSGRMSALALQKERGADAEDDLKYKMIGEREKARDRGESLRVFYVGATRAKHRLVLSAAAPKIDDDGNYKPSSRSILGRLALAGALDEVQVETVDVSNLQVTDTMLRLDATASIALPPVAPVRLRHEERPSDIDTTVVPEAFEVSSLPRNVGISTHALLERIALDGVDAWDETRVNGLGPRIRRSLSRLGTTSEELEAGAVTVARALTQTLGDATGRWLLADHDEARCEWKLSRFESGGARTDETNASLDRTFVVDGLRWIIDYKVIEPGSTEDVEAYIASKVETYRAQLESYADLVGTLEPDRPIYLGLYFPLLARFVGWKRHSNKYSDAPLGV